MTLLETNISSNNNVSESPQAAWEITGERLPAVDVFIKVNAKVVTGFAMPLRNNTVTK